MDSVIFYEDDNQIENQIKIEVEDLEKVAASIGPDQIKDGSWFTNFVHAMLSSYGERIIKEGGSNYFREKYPGLTQDAIAEKLCTMAMRYAAIAGGIAGATTSAGVLGKVKFPVIIGAIGGEILFTIRLQVRLIYDLATVYGDPIDINDPEQLYRVFMLAYGISGLSSNVGAVAMTTGPEVVRAQTYRVITGNMKAIQQTFIKILGPRIGRMFTRKAILNAVVPIAGIAMSSGWNYVSTKKIAELGQQELRLEALAQETAVDLCNEAKLTSEDLPIIVQALQSMISIDGTIDPRELKVYLAVVKSLNVPKKSLREIESHVEINPDSVEIRLRSINSSKLRKTIADLLKLAAAASGTIAPSELDLLNRFLPALDQQLDLEELYAKASRFNVKSNKAKKRRS